MVHEKFAIKRGLDLLKLNAENWKASRKTRRRSKILIQSRLDTIPKFIVLFYLAICMWQISWQLITCISRFSHQLLLADVVFLLWERSTTFLMNGSKYVLYVTLHALICTVLSRSKYNTEKNYNSVDHSLEMKTNLKFPDIKIISLNHNYSMPVYGRATSDVEEEFFTFFLL